MLVSNSAAFCKKTQGSFKNRETSGLLSKLGITILLSNIPLFGDILFLRLKIVILF